MPQHLNQSHNKNIYKMAARISANQIDYIRDLDSEILDILHEFETGAREMTPEYFTRLNELREHYEEFAEKWKKEAKDLQTRFADNLDGLRYYSEIRLGYDISTATAPPVKTPPSTPESRARAAIMMEMLDEVFYEPWYKRCCTIC
jgi:hypothetical protein